MNKFLVWAVAPVFIVGMSAAVRANEITLIAPGGIRAAVDQMIPAFEKSTGHKVKATFGSGGGTKERVINGEPFDVPIVQPPYPDVLASGHVIPSSATPLASVAVGVAVRTGARSARTPVAQVFHAIGTVMPVFPIDLDAFRFRDGDVFRVCDHHFN